MQTPFFSNYKALTFELLKNVVDLFFCFIPWRILALKEKNPAFLFHSLALYTPWHKDKSSVIEWQQAEMSH